MKSLNLCLHAGASKASLAEVLAVTTPTPVDRWCPISHRAVYDQVVSALGSLNMTVVQEQHALARNGQRYFALLQVANCVEASADFSYVLGIRNSHDKTFPAGLVVGSGVFVCDNLAFNGEIRLARRHTTNIMRDLPSLTARAVGQLSDKWHTMAQRFDVYKQRELTNAQAHDLVIRGMDTGACTGQQIPHILKEWRAPRHPEFVQAGRTAWRLFNAFTEVSKESGVFVTANRTQSLHALMDAECGLEVARN